MFYFHFYYSLISGHYPKNKRNYLKKLNKIRVKSNHPSLDKLFLKIGEIIILLPKKILTEKKRKPVLVISIRPLL